MRRTRSKINFDAPLLRRSPSHHVRARRTGEKKTEGAPTVFHFRMRDSNAPIPDHSRPRNISIAGCCRRRGCAPRENASGFDLSIANYLLPQRDPSHLCFESRELHSKLPSFTLSLVFLALPAARSSRSSVPGWRY